MPYSYAWNDAFAQTTSSATILSSQSYTVTVTDNNGCFDTSSVLINEPQEILVSISSLPSICGQNTGSITATTFGTATQNAYGTRTVSTNGPSGGSDGDIWYKY